MSDRNATRNKDPKYGYTTGNFKSLYIFFEFLIKGYNARGGYSRDNRGFGGRPSGPGALSQSSAKSRKSVRPVQLWFKNKITISLILSDKYSWNFLTWIIKLERLSKKILYGILVFSNPLISCFLFLIFWTLWKALFSQIWNIRLIYPFIIIGMGR